MPGWISLIKTAALQVISPRRCAHCGALSDRPLCGPCLSRVMLVDGPLCGRCGRSLPPGAAIGPDCRACRDTDVGFTLCRGVWHYQGPVESVVKAFKYAGKPYYSDFLGEALNAHLQTRCAELMDPKDIKAIVASPMHPSRKKERGYDHAGLLAQALGRASGLSAVPALVKIRPTKAQAGLKLKEREANVAGAFKAARMDRIAGHPVLLVDDVLTTGATIRECSRTLRDAGAGPVYALTLARRDL